MLKKSLLVALLVLPVTLAHAEDKADLSTLDAKVSYIIGLQFGQGLAGDQVPVDMKALSAGVGDAMKGAKPRLTPDQMKEAMQAFQTKQVEMQKKAGEANLKKGQEYQAAFKKKAGVKATKSGLLYRVITAGKGTPPKATDKVTVHYRGTLVSGEEFDSSIGRGQPATFPVNGVIKGWQEVLQLMPPGSKWEVVIPSDLAYGPQGTGHGIGPNETLTFEIDLLKVN